MNTQKLFENHPRTERFFRENEALLAPLHDMLVSWLLQAATHYSERLAEGQLYGSPEGLVEAMKDRGIENYTNDDVIDIVLSEMADELTWMERHIHVAPFGDDPR